MVGLFRKSCSTWWINFFKDLNEQRILDPTSELQTECLWFCFSDLIQQTLDDVKEQWNTHYICRSRFDTVDHKGRPDSLYYLPELNIGINHFLLPVPEAETNYARSHIVETEEDNL